MSRNLISVRAELLPLLFFLLLFSVLTNELHAQSLTLPGWTSNSIALSGNRIGYSSPTVAELDGDIANGKEIVLAGVDGKIYAYHADGTLLWEASAPDSGCGGPSTINSSPAVGDLYGKGQQYVVVGYGGFVKHCNGGVVALKGTDGSTAWDFSTATFAKKEKFWAVLHAVFPSPAVADTDGDGKMEVGFGSFDRNIYLLNGDGSVRWYYTAADTVWSSPSFANLDTDKNLEMIVGTDISQNLKINPPTANGGNLYAFKTKKGARKKYNFRDPKAFLWMLPLEQTIFSSPAIGDVLPENPGLEVVVNSGCYFPERTNLKVGKWTKVISGKTGKVLQTLPLEACSPSSPALGDLDGDGTPEIVVTVNGATSIGGDGSSRIEAFKANNVAPFWSIIPTFRGQNYAFGGNFLSPVLADVDGNGSIEVIAPVASGVGIYNGADGTALTCESGSCEDLMQLRTADVLINTPVVTDVNNDGVLDIIVGGKHSNGHGAIYGWTNLASVIDSPAAGFGEANQIPWGMFKKDSGHGGKL